MKKVLVVLVLGLVSTLSYSQCSKYREYAPLQLSLQVGTSYTLGGELLYQNEKNIVGFGYSIFAGSNEKELLPGETSYQVIHEALYLTYLRQVNDFVIGVRGGKQNNIEWIKTYSPSGGSYTFEKDFKEYTALVGGYVGYCVTENVRLGVGYDTFNNVTVGFTAGF